MLVPVRVPVMSSTAATSTRLDSRHAQWNSAMACEEIVGHLAFRGVLSLRLRLGKLVGFFAAPSYALQSISQRTIHENSNRREGLFEE